MEQNKTGKYLKYVLTISIGFISCFLFAQQGPDLNYNPEIANPAYHKGQGSLIFIDEGHHNFHTREGRYAPFANLLESDGYVVKSFTEKFTNENLKDIEILVIANALNEANVEIWDLPNPPAFTDEEVNALEKWVTNGGKLFLLADHMPFPAAAETLAVKFGFKFHNAFNVDIVNPAYFWRSNGSIVESIITSGRDSSEVINRIPKTEGQAFEIPKDATSILKFYGTSLLLYPEKDWHFDSNTRLKRAEGMSQGAFKEHGKGRIVVFGEASLFSAQIGQPGNRKMGMNSDTAKDNYKLLLNCIHWLDNILN